MPRTILLPLDGSELAGRAIPWAALLARDGAADVLLVYARAPVIASARHPEVALLARAQACEAQHRAFRQVHTATDALLAEHITSAVISQRGVASSVILDVSQRRRADLIVMSSHGEGGVSRMVFGSVADAVCRATRLPLLVVPAHADHPVPDAMPMHVLVALDGSELAERALQSLPHWSMEATFAPVLLRVVPSEQDLVEAERYLENLAQSWVVHGSTRETRLEIGEAAAAIVRVARVLDTDMIAMGTHGRGGLPRLVLGSVASAVVARANTPVLLWPHSVPAACWTTPVRGRESVVPMP